MVVIQSGIEFVVHFDMLSEIIHFICLLFYRCCVAFHFLFNDFFIIVDIVENSYEESKKKLS